MVHTQGIHSSSAVVLFCRRSASITGLFFCCFLFLPCLFLLYTCHVLLVVSIFRVVSVLCNFFFFFLSTLTCLHATSQRRQDLQNLLLLLRLREDLLDLQLLAIYLGHSPGRKVVRGG